MTKILIEEAKIKQVLEALDDRTSLMKWQRARDSLREALAEQPAQQEPVPCCGKYETCTQACTPRGRFLGKRDALAEQPAKPQQEPVGALILGGVIDTSDGPEYEEWDIEWNHKAIEALQYRLVTSDPVTLNIYTTPPAQRKPLTDDEIRSIWSNGDCFEEVAFARAIEAKLKEKNT